MAIRAVQIELFTVRVLCGVSYMEYLTRLIPEVAMTIEWSNTNGYLARRSTLRDKLFSTILVSLKTNKRLLISGSCMLYMEWTRHWSTRTSSDTVSFTVTYHTWQFIIFTIFTITTCIFSYSLSISSWTQDLALQQILSSIDLFLLYRTDSTDSRAI